MNKSYIKIYVVLVIIFVLLISFSMTFLKEEKVKNGFIIAGEKQIFEYNNKTWQYSTQSKVEWKKFNVYSGLSYIGKYYLTNNNNKYYFFDDNNDSNDVQYPFIAISNGLNIELIDYFKEDIDNNDINIIFNYLKKKRINYDGDYSIKNKYVIDLNNDGKNDSIYFISNQLYSNDIFYVVFAKVGFKYIDISIERNNEIKDRYDLGWVISSKNKNYYDIILKGGNSEYPDYYLLSYNNNVYNFLSK